MNLKELTDAEIVLLYRAWSEEAYAAGFITESEAIVRQFIRWLKNSPPPQEDYEENMVRIFREIVNEQ